MKNMINLNFTSFEDEVPEHNANIIYLKLFGEFGSIVFAPIERQVIYVWCEIDDENYLTGNTITYDEETESCSVLGDCVPCDGTRYILSYYLSCGSIPDKVDLWSYSNEVFDKFEDHISRFED